MDKVAMMLQQAAQAHLEADRERELLLLTDLGDTFSELGAFPKALESYRQASDIARSLGNRQHEVSILGKLGNTYKALEQHKEALSVYEQALTIATEMQDQKLMSSLLGGLGLVMKDIGAISRAIELYEQALVLARQLGDLKAERGLLGNLGNAYASQGQTNRAIVCYEQALAVAHQLGDERAEGIILGNLGNAYASQGQAQHAISLYDQALALLARQDSLVRSELFSIAAIYRNRGNASIVLEEFQNAVTDYDRAIALEPDDAAAYTGRADALAQMGHYEEALVSYDRAIPLDPENAAIYTSKGDALVQLRRYEEALASYDRALALDPESADAYAGRGDSLTNMRRYQGALASYDQAIRLSHDEMYHYQKQQLLARMQGETGIDLTIPSAVASMEAYNEMVALLESSTTPTRIKRGDVIDGVIVRIDQDEILVDIGLESEGVLSTKELPATGDWAFDQLHLNDKVLVYVIQPETPDGPALLSLKRANTERQWRIAEEQYKNGELIKAQAIDYNIGGLIVDVSGIRGYVPISQILNLTREEVAAGGDNQETAAKLQSMKDKELQLKIIEINRARNRLILSERLAVQEWRQRRREELLNELKPGEVRRGVVSNLANFGAFVDLGGADGLVHISQLAWSRVDHPSEVLKVGQEVEVRVLSVDKDKKKIALSIKRAEVDPWTTVEQRYTPGQVVTGTITKIAPFGAFARIEDGIEGLIHLSELTPGMDPTTSLHEGQQLQLRILRIDAERRRLGLSLRQADKLDATKEAPAEAAPATASAPATGSDKLMMSLEEAAPLQGERDTRPESRGRERVSDNPLLSNLPFGEEDETIAMAEAFRAAARQRSKEEPEAGEE